LKRTGVGKALLSAALFGVSAAIAKGLLSNVTAQTLAGLLYIGSGSGLLVTWLAQKAGGKRPELALGRRDVPWLAGAILFGGVLAPLLLLLGLERTPASSASLLLNLEGVFTAVLAWMVFKENADRRIVLGMLAIVIGGALLSWQGTLAWGGLVGPFAITAATLCWGIDNNLTQKISASDPVQIGMVKGLVAGTINLMIGLALTGAIPPIGTVGGALLLGFLSYGLSLVLFIRALRDLGTARTGAYFSLAPFIGAVAAFILWRDPITPLFVAGALFMIIGLIIHLTERHEHGHVHDPMTHAHRHTHDAHHSHDHTAGDSSGEPHTHAHTHERLDHEHGHYPDLHHRHPH
jgi:drug/metabolite transporter (DMT)-like permease